MSFPPLPPLPAAANSSSSSSSFDYRPRTYSSSSGYQQPTRSQPASPTKSTFAGDGARNHSSDVDLKLEDEASSLLRSRTDRQSRTQSLSISRSAMAAVNNASGSPNDRVYQDPSNPLAPPMYNPSTRLATARENIIALASSSTASSSGEPTGAPKTLASIMGGASRPPRLHRVGTGPTEEEREGVEKLEREMEIKRAQWEQRGSSASVIDDTRGQSLASLVHGQATMANGNAGGRNEGGSRPLANTFSRGHAHSMSYSPAAPMPLLQMDTKVSASMSSSSSAAASSSATPLASPPIVRSHTRSSSYAPSSYISTNNYAPTISSTLPPPLASPPKVRTAALHYAPPMPTSFRPGHGRSASHMPSSASPAPASSPSAHTQYSQYRPASSSSSSANAPARPSPIPPPAAFSQPQQQQQPRSIGAMFGTSATGPRLNRPTPSASYGEGSSGPSHARTQSMSGFAMPGMARTGGGASAAARVGMMTSMLEVEERSVPVLKVNVADPAAAPSPASGRYDYSPKGSIASASASTSSFVTISSTTLPSKMIPPPRSSTASSPSFVTRPLASSPRTDVALRSVSSESDPRSNASSVYAPASQLEVRSSQNLPVHPQPPPRPSIQPSRPNLLDRSFTPPPSSSSSSANPVAINQTTRPAPRQQSQSYAQYLPQQQQQQQQHRQPSPQPRLPFSSPPLSSVASPIFRPWSNPLHNSAALPATSMAHPSAGAFRNNVAELVKSAEQLQQASIPSYPLSAQQRYTWKPSDPSLEVEAIRGHAGDIATAIVREELRSSSAKDDAGGQLGSNVINRSDDAMQAIIPPRPSFSSRPSLSRATRPASPSLTPSAAIISLASPPLPPSLPIPRSSLGTTSRAISIDANRSPPLVSIQLPTSVIDTSKYRRNPSPHFDSPEMDSMSLEEEKEDGQTWSLSSDNGLGLQSIEQAIVGPDRSSKEYYKLLEDFDRERAAKRRVASTNGRSIVSPLVAGILEPIELVLSSPASSDSHLPASLPSSPAVAITDAPVHPTSPSTSSTPTLSSPPAALSPLILPSKPVSTVSAPPASIRSPSSSMGSPTIAAIPRVTIAKKVMPVHIPPPIQKVAPPSVRVIAELPSIAAATPGTSSAAALDTSSSKASVRKSSQDYAAGFRKPAETFASEYAPSSRSAPAVRHGRTQSHVPTSMYSASITSSTVSTASRTAAISPKQMESDLPSPALSQNDVSSTAKPGLALSPVSTRSSISNYVAAPGRPAPTPPPILRTFSNSSSSSTRRTMSISDVLGSSPDHAAASIRSSGTTARPASLTLVSPGPSPPRQMSRSRSSNPTSPRRMSISTTAGSSPPPLLPIDLSSLLRPSVRSLMSSPPLGPTLSTEFIALTPSSAKSFDCRGIFYETETIAIAHRSTITPGRTLTSLFVWRGRESEKESDAAGTSDRIAELVGHFKTEAIEMRQGRETSALLRTLGGQLIIRRGSREDDDRCQSRCFVVRSEMEGVFIDELAVSAASICSAHCNVISSMGEVFVWIGAGALNAERRAASKFGSEIADGRNVIKLEEGKESEYFWHLLDSTDMEYASANHWRYRRLARTSVSLLDISPESNPSITRNDALSLSASNISLLDAGFEYVVLVPSRLRSSKRGIALALATAQGLASGWKDRQLPFMPTCHVLCFPSLIPKDLSFASRKLDWSVLNEGTMASKLDIYTIDEARELLC